MEFRTLNESELSEWADHCASVFSGPEDTPEYFLNHYLLDPTRDPNGVFLAVDGDTIASTLRVFRREIYLGGQRVSMGGIGEVCTKPGYQKQGLSGELLRMAIEYMGREALNVSLLFTGVNGHYARYGWFTVPTRSVVMAIEDAPALPDGDVIRKMERADLAAVKSLCAARHAKLDGPVVRDSDAYWDGWMPDAWNVPHVVERAGRIAAYADAWSAQGTWRMKDFARAEDGPDIAACAAAHARAMGWDVKRLAVPAAYRPRQSGPFIENTGTMARLNAPFELHGQPVDAPDKLFAALSNLTFFGVDSF